MKMLCAGVEHMKGIGKESGNPYDMATMVGLVPVENIKHANGAINGYGYKVAEVQVAPDAVESFKDVKFPCWLDLETDAIPRMGKFETVVVGFKPVQAAVKAA